MQPYVAIGKTAIQQGHQVSICTGKSFQKLIEDNGIVYEKCSLDFYANFADKGRQRSI